jgi:hypothetical protein
MPWRVGYLHQEQKGTSTLMVLLPLFTRVPKVHWQGHPTGSCHPHPYEQYQMSFKVWYLEANAHLLSNLV